MAVTQTSEALARRPDHVPEELVRDFDFYAIPESDRDLQAAYHAVQQANPDIFWTPRNGGHWVATRADDIVTMQRDYRRFSQRFVSLPPMPEGTPAQIPLELDPPLHGQYRRPLIQALQPGVLRQLEENVRAVAINQIEYLVARGGCEFMADFAKVLPIHVFLDMVDLPLADKEFLLPVAELAVRSPDAMGRLRAQQEMAGYLAKWVALKREQPGDDLLSRIVNTEVDGDRIPIADAVNYAALLLFGGLDTVAGMIGLIGKFLAEHPAHRAQLVAHLDNQKFLTNAVEELIRRHGIANTARLITADFEYKGVQFHQGDRILPPNLLVGVDERANADPLAVDFSRKAPVHAAFGNGPHSCPGAGLARREIRVFLQEWLSRIPEFSVAPGTQPKLVTGQVNGILELHLVWP